MRPFKQLLFLSILVLSLFSACKNDDDKDPEKSNEEMLAGATSKDWKVTAITATTTYSIASAFTFDIFNNKIYLGTQVVPAGQLGIPEIPEFPECAKDDVITFKTDKTYVVKEGTPCDDESTFFTAEGGQWSFSSDKKTLILNDNTAGNINYSISKITDTTIEGENELSFTIENQPITLKIKTVFTAQ